MLRAMKIPAVTCASKSDIQLDTKTLQLKPCNNHIMHSFHLNFYYTFNLKLNYIASIPCCQYGIKLICRMTSKDRGGVTSPILVC